MMIQRPDVVERLEFDSGYPTTTGTLRRMARAVEEDHVDPRIRARARQILRDYGPIDSMDIDGEIAAVWRFVVENVRYVRDPLGAEHITSAVELDKEVDDGSAMEDCESLALYAATLLASIGIPSEFEIQGRRPERPDRFSHCCLRVQNPRTKEWVSFDPIGFYEFPEWFTLGDTLHRDGEPIEHWDLNGEKVEELAGMLGELFGADDLATAKQYGDPVADIAMKAGPYGMLVGGLWKGGTAIASAVAPTPAATPTPQAAPLKQTPGGPKMATKYVLAKPTVTAQQVLAAGQPKASGSGWIAPVLLGLAVLLAVRTFSR